MRGTTARNLDRQLEVLEHRYGDLLDSAARADVVIINGEGGLLGRKGVGRLTLLYAYALSVRGCEVALVNHTVDLCDPGLRELAAIVYPVLSDVAVRERASVDALKGIRNDARLAADAAFAITNGPMSPGGYICIGGSAAYLRSQKKIPQLIEDYTELAERLSKYGPVVVTVASLPDDRVLLPVAQRLDLKVYGLGTATETAVDVLGSAALYVGGRWHPSLLALAGGCPVVPFGSNSGHKARGIAQIAGTGVPVIAADQIGLHLDSIERSAAEILARGGQARAAVTERVEAFMQTAVGNVEVLRRRGEQ